MVVSFNAGRLSQGHFAPLIPTRITCCQSECVTPALDHHPAVAAAAAVAAPPPVVAVVVAVGAVAPLGLVCLKP